MKLHAAHASPRAGRSRLTRAFSALLSSVMAASLLVACTGNSDYSTGQSSAQQNAAAQSQEAVDSSRTRPLKVGDKFTIPCGYGKNTSCMEVEIKDVGELTGTSASGSSQCADLEYQPLKGNEKLLYVDLSATMPQDADKEFTSPFRNSPWRAVTKAKEISRASDLLCNTDKNHFDLADEFPGLSASGRFFLKVPASTVALQLKDHELIATVDVTQTRRKQGSADKQDSAESQDAAKRRDLAPQPTTNPQSNQRRGTAIGMETGQNPAGGSRETPASTVAPNQSRNGTTTGETDDRPIGFTKAPGLEVPHPLNKSVSSCATDYTLYQRGTTFFTDGTSGWTEQCAAAMDAAMPAS